VARIKLIEIEEAEGLVKEVYDDIQRVRGEGMVSNLLKGFANFPELLKANWERMCVIMGKGNLSKKLKESIALGLAVANGCTY
jgi:alkylhydroperoxidase/carboxymuconolactone decarboxylase family protein YurZ